MIHARGRGVEYSEHEAPLSIKCVFKGQEVHEVGGIPYAVDENSYLLLNHGRRYASRIGAEEAETFSIFFERRFTEQALRSWLDPVDDLLSDPDASSTRPVDFVESLYPRDATLARLLTQLREESDGGYLDGAHLDERLYAVLSYLWSRHSDLLRRIEALPAVRRSTRIEQYRRLRRARDYIDANLAGDLDLAGIAAVACLSPFHLLRLFKGAFGRTPQQYATERRLRRARELVERTDLPVSEICYQVGYESLGSFSYRFKRHFGASPRELRGRRGPTSGEKSKIG